MYSWRWKPRTVGTLRGPPAWGLRGLRTKGPGTSSSEIRRRSVRPRIVLRGSEGDLASGSLEIRPAEGFAAVYFRPLVGSEELQHHSKKKQGFMKRLVGRVRKERLPDRKEANPRRCPSQQQQQQGHDVEAVVGSDPPSQYIDFPSVRNTMETAAPRRSTRWVPWLQKG